MDRSISLRLGLIVLLAGCGGGSADSEEQTRQRVAADTVATAADAHAGHAVRDSAAEGAVSTPSGAGTAHGAGGAGEAEHAGHAGMQSAASGGAAGGAGQGMDHSRMDHAEASRQGSGATADHAGHGASAPREAAADHARHAAAPAHRETEPSRAVADPHAGHLAPGGSAIASGDPTADTEKLLTLVAELVQDSVVQRRIQEDPVLREKWQDPAVRRIILQRR